MAVPTAQEQLFLEYVNETRLDPLGNAARYITSYGGTARSADPDIDSALRFFGVSGQALLQAFTALTPVAPLAWSETLANAAQGHNAAMIAGDEQSHQLPGEPDLGARATAAGYNYTNLGENVFAFADNPLQGHAGFMVDWGNGPNGMQSPAGHRDNIMNGAYREIGVAVTAETNAATSVGPLVVTEDLGRRSGAGAYVTGVAYNDTDGNDFYSVGEGLGSLNVSVSGAGAVASYASGGYSLFSSLTGARTVTLSGGGLAGPVNVVLNLAAGGAVKLDVVSGTELKTSASAVVSGPVSVIEAIGVQGLSLTAADAGTHRLSGATGADTLVGGAGTDSLLGGLGNDSLAGGNGAGYLRGADGDDYLQGGDQFDDSHGNIGNDTVHGGGFDDWVVGGQGNDMLFGDDGGDLCYGQLGTDTVDGGAGDDAVVGGQGNDVLNGGAGNDFVTGDRGDDTVTGGLGADTFHTNNVTGLDRVTDFSAAQGDKVLVDVGSTYTLAQVGADVVIDMG